MGITTNYKGIEITYNETSDEWTCELASREYRKVSLAKIKNSIDEFFKKEKKFERFEAISLSSYYDDKFLKRVTVTSKADYNRYWVSWDGKREKANREMLAKITPENEKLIAYYWEQNAITSKAAKEMRDTLKKLERI